MTIEWKNLVVGSVALEPQPVVDGKQRWMLVIKEAGTEWPFGLVGITELSFGRLSKTIPVLKERIWPE
jgi:hypothetical protein